MRPEEYGLVRIGRVGLDGPGGVDCSITARTNSEHVPNTHDNIVDEMPAVTANSSDEADHPTGIKLWLIIFVVSAVLTLSSVDMNIVATAVPSITDHFHTVADVGWYSSAFRLCSCSFQFVFGKAYKLFSVKHVFLLANAISIVGSLLCGTAATSTMLVVGRAVAGLGSCGMFSGCFVILAQSLPLHRRPLFISVMGGIEGLATMAAPLLGGALTQSLGWRWCFYISLPIGVATMLLAASCLPNAKKTAEIMPMTFTQKIWQLDLVSNLLLIPSLVSLFLALSWAGIKYSWGSGRVIGTLSTFAILLAGFVYRQSRQGDTAALPSRVMRRRSVIAGLIFIMCANGTGNVIEYYLPTYYQIVRGYTPAKSGYMMLPIIIGATLGSLVHGVGTTVFGYYAPFMLFASIVMPIAAGLITTFTTSTTMEKLILYTGLSGFAYGIGFSGPQNAILTVLPKEDIPLGVSVMLFAQSFGPTVAIAIAQVIFTNQLSVNLNGVVLSLSKQNITNNGLMEIVRSVRPERSRDVILGIDESLSQTLYFVVGLASITMIGSLLIEWRSVKQKNS